MQTINFCTPIDFGSYKQHIGDSLLEVADDYFYLGGKKAEVINNIDPQGYYPVQFDDETVSMMETVIKVVSYLTVIIPLIVFVAKVTLRSMYDFEIPATPVGIPHKAVGGVKVSQTDSPPRVAKQSLSRSKLIALENAAKNGHLDILEALLASGDISDKDRGSAAIEAAKGGRLKIVEVLCANGSISEEDRGFIVGYALRKEPLDGVIRLLGNTSLSQTARGIAAIRAAIDGRLDALEALLASGNISDEARGRAARYAAEKGHLEIVEVLSANGSISEEDRGDIVGYALRKEPLDVVIRLLGNTSLSQTARGIAAIRAAIDGRLDALEALLASGDISDEARGRAAIYAAEKGHLKIVEALFASGDISDEDRGTAVINAAGRERLDVLEVLLASGDISDEDRDFAIFIASVYKRETIVPTLLANRNMTNIPPPIVKANLSEDHDNVDALLDATRDGHLDKVTTLLAKGEFSDSDCDLAIENAAREGHSDIVAVLLESWASSAWRRYEYLLTIADSYYTQQSSSLLNQALGWRNIGKALLANGDISELANGDISDEDRDLIVRWATRYGLNDILERLNGEWKNTRQFKTEVQQGLKKTRCTWSIRMEIAGRW
ncbi:MAG: ankyrin repeat domain-containing protein [Chlamydiales bacterium]|nr:ankyrin repeat domain-containing protein [Chlamydiales bacterium]